MAEHVVLPLNIKLHSRIDTAKRQLSVRKNSQFQIGRKCYPRTYGAVGLSSRDGRKLGSYLSNVKINQVEERSTKCCCLGTFIAAGNPANSEWIIVADQVLLMASAFLTYIAGITPDKKMYGNAREDDLDDASGPKNYCAGGSKEYDKEVNFQFAWDEVEGKLLDSMHAMKEVTAEDQVTRYKREVALQTMSLYALLERPRLRLAWSSFQWLKKEVNNLRENCVFKSIEEPLLVFARILQNSSQPVCLAWLEEELNLSRGMSNKAFLSSMINKLSGDESMLHYIKKLGKLDLYAEFLFAIVCGSSRSTGYYDYSLFTQHGVALLEDLVITLANGIASMYLNLLSVDSSVPNEVTGLGLKLCTLSTRELQRIRNEVALQQWMHQNMESVASMYEDRFELCTLERTVIKETAEHEAGEFNWLKKIGLWRAEGTSSPLSLVVISPVSIYVKRTKELRALTGWRYYFSLLLEFGDIALPVIRAFIAKVSEAISFFLVCLIGRSLGLIYTGIRQSLRWK